MHLKLNPWNMHHKGVGTSLAGPVLAGPLFLKVKTKFHFA